MSPSAPGPASLLRSLIVLFYSCAMAILAPVLSIFARFSPKLAAQLEGRDGADRTIPTLAKLRSRKRTCALFFCSSAGEYEQAKPLVDRLAADPSRFVHVVFFSRSGRDFVKARGETISMSLAPASDSVWVWGRIFSALRPDIITVVRHELWPGFLETARNFGRLYLIDASRSEGEARSKAKRGVRGALLAYFDKIFTVGEEDARFFAAEYGIPAGRLLAVGDTKYDRVLERAAASRDQLAEIRKTLGGGADDRRLVIGSAYQQDVEAWLAAVEQIGDGARPWQTVIAPHHVDGDLPAWILKQARAKGLEAKLYSELARGDGSAQPQVVIVDRMGILAELYGTASLAFVGGALHAKVHNVLEPAGRGLAVAFGPFYKNSAEAVQLVEQGLAEVCADGTAFANWWRRHLPDASGDGRVADGQQPIPASQSLQSLSGAADRILAAWGVDRDAR